MRATLALALLAALALSVPGAVRAKGFGRVVLVASDGRWVEVRAAEPTIDGLLSRRGSARRSQGGYLRLFFTGAGDFPANPGRYYPAGRCVALDWPRYETTCRRVSPTLVRLLRPAEGLARFHVRPTVVAGIVLPGSAAGVSVLKSPVELALARRGRAGSLPSGCYAFAAQWRGSEAARRPGRFHICADGVYADGRRHPLGRGPWDWLRLNAGPAPTRASYSTKSGLTVELPADWRVIDRRLTECTNPLERLTVAGRGALVMLQESLDPRHYIHRFSPRPRRFELRGAPQWIACCAPPGRGRGWFFNFRDRGRGFYTYVYLGEEGTRDEALAILDSLRVRPR